MTRPTPDELAEAIEEFLSGEILPALDDHRLRFRMLVALNALGILRRELGALPEKDDTELRELAAQIRAGDVPSGTLARVKAGGPVDIQRSGIGSRLPSARSRSVSVMRASGGVRLNLQADPAQDGGDALAFFVGPLVRDCATVGRPVRTRTVAAHARRVFREQLNVGAVRIHNINLRLPGFPRDKGDLPPIWTVRR